MPNSDNTISDTDIMSNILNIGRRRERIIYYRPDGQGGFIPTCPLPADAFSKVYYMSKGFKTQMPEVKEVKEAVIKPIEIVNDGKVHCPICQTGFESALGLRSHLRVHIEKEEIK